MMHIYVLEAEREDIFNLQILFNLPPEEIENWN